MKSRSEQTIENPALQQLSGVLTREKWDQWHSVEMAKTFDATASQNASIIDLIYSRLHGYYDVISGSEWIVSNFLSLPGGIQSVLLELLKFPVEASTIEAFFKLVLEFDASDESINCSEQDYSEFSRSIRATCREPSVRWEKSRDDFRSLFKTSHVMIKSIVMNNTALILSHQFGEDRFIEVTSAFTLQDAEVDLEVFINLVKRWDEFSKYPLAWAINLAKT